MKRCFILLKDIALLGDIPDDVTHLFMSSKISEIRVIPKSVKFIEFIYVDIFLEVEAIPSNVKYLKLVCMASSPPEIRMLPSSLKSLSFGDNFNQLLAPGVIPQSVKFLNFGNNFNQDLAPGVIPQSVKFLSFGDNFNQDLINLPSLNSLRVSHNFNKKIIFPPELEKLHIYNSGRRVKKHPLIDKFKKDIGRLLRKEFNFIKNRFNFLVKTNYVNFIFNKILLKS